MSTDPWDDVVNLESELFNIGVHQGEIDAIEDKTIYNDGIHTGFMKGYAISLEVSFIENTLQTIFKETNVITDDITTKDMVLNEENSTRLTRRRIELLKKCQNLPLINNDNIDFIKELYEIRSLYKQCQCNHVGEFLSKSNPMERNQTQECNSNSNA